jgi:hypothetical protein
MLESISLVGSCTNNKKGFEEKCPYVFSITAHFSKVSIDVIPHSKNYSIGDSGTIVSEYSNPLISQLKLKLLLSYRTPI